LGSQDGSEPMLPLVPPLSHHPIIWGGGGHNRIWLSPLLRQAAGQQIRTDHDWTPNHLRVSGIKVLWSFDLREEVLEKITLW